MILMIQLPMHSTGAFDRASIASVNHLKPSSAVSADNILSLNTRKSSAIPGSRGTAGHTETFAQSVASAAHDAPAPDCQTRSAPAYQTRSVSAPRAVPVPSTAKMALPALCHPIAKGQKASLQNGRQLSSIQACFGWNVQNAACDVDVSAFLLNNSGKVIGDSWFVFYGQTKSPDNSTSFIDHAPNDREIITIDFTKLDPAVHKIAFVLTINDAFEKKLNFAMIKDAYIRIMDASDHSELVSFRLEEAFSNVISLMIGEIYQYNGMWKFSAAGNGLARDLAGLCEFYGVEVV